MPTWPSCNKLSLGKKTVALILSLLFKKHIYSFERVRELGKGRERVSEVERKGEERQSDTDRDVFHHLPHSPNSHNYWGSTGLKPGVQSFTWVSHIDFRDPSMWVTFYCWKLDTKWSNEDSNHASMVSNVASSNSAG